MWRTAALLYGTSVIEQFLGELVAVLCRLLRSLFLVSTCRLTPSTSLRLQATNTC